MQTFLPYSSFDQSARVLDNKRLSKQIVETQQILNCLQIGGNWSNHPAVRMWAGFSAALCRYGEALMVAFIKRGFDSGHKSWDKISEVMIKNGWDRLSPVFPPWLGDQKLHDSHRSRLLHKGNLDNTRKRAKLYIKDRKVDDFVRDFFKSKTKLYLRNLTVAQCKELNDFFDEKGLETYDNWYEQFNWDLRPSDDYYWPVELFSKPRGS
jgi:hypothetical protein